MQVHVAACSLNLLSDSRILRGVSKMLKADNTFRTKINQRRTFERIEKTNERKNGR